MANHIDMQQPFLERAMPPTYFPVKPFKLMEPQEIPFDNGIHGTYFHNDQQDLVRIEWIFRNAYHAGDEDALIPSCLPTMLLEGTVTRSNAVIADSVDFHGAYLVPEFNSDYSTLTLFALNKHLPALLPLVRELLTQPSFPDKELSTYLRNRRQRLEVALQKNDFLARRIFHEVLFGETRYGRAPGLDDFERVNREDLQTYFQRTYHPSNCTLTIAGNVSAEVLDLIKQEFDGSWLDAAPPTNPALPLAPPSFPSNKGERHVHTRVGALQSAIRLGNRTISRQHPDFPGLQFVNTALGGYFGSRLMANIREDKGYTYGIGSGIVSLKHSAYLTIATEVGVDVTSSALEEIEREIRMIKEEPMQDPELELVRNYLMGNLLGSLENVFSHADHFKQVYFSGLGMEYYDNYQQTILAMTAEKVQELANRYLHFEQMDKVIVGKISNHD